MAFRTVVTPVTTENSGAQVATLGSGPVNVPTIYPKKAGPYNIVGIVLSITASLTLSAAGTFNVGQLVKEITFKRGSDTLIDVNGEAQLERVFHILTGQPVGATFNSQAPVYYNNPTSASSTSPSATETIYLPLRFSGQGTPLAITLTANALSAVTNATAGTISFVVEFHYAPIPVTDDRIRIVTSPTALNANTDIDISQQFSESRPVQEVWIDVTADANLAYETFSVGQTVVYDHAGQAGLLTLTGTEDPVPTFSHLAGVFKLLVTPGTAFPTAGATSNAPKLICNFTASVTPTYYLVLSSQPVAAGKTGGK
jgi:hypothetical protein